MDLLSCETSEIHKKKKKQAKQFKGFRKVLREIIKWKTIQEKSIKTSQEI